MCGERGPVRGGDSRYSARRRVLGGARRRRLAGRTPAPCLGAHGSTPHTRRSEEHTSELQSQSNLVCRLLLEKKKKKHQEHLNQTTKASTIEVCHAIGGNLTLVT